MKLLIPLLLLLCSTATAQQITETLYSFKKSYNPLFSNKAASLQIDLNKKYEVGGQDTTYTIVIDAKENVVESTSGSISYSTLEVIKNYDVDRLQSAVVLSPAEFEQFYKQINQVYAHITSLDKGKYSNNVTASCKLRELVIAGNYDPKLKTKFFFQVGEGPTFSADAAGILEIATALNKIRGRVPA